MKARLSVSIAMATFNGAPYLRDQLESLARQTELPCELVVTDDGSLDETEAIIRQFAQSAPFPVRWHRNPERLGYRGNFMRASSLCIGNLIAFCDQDDVWYPEKVRSSTKAFEDPELMVFHHEAKVVRGGVILHERLNKLRDTRPRVGGLGSAPWQFPLGFTLVFRSCLRAFDDFWPESLDYRWPEDRSSHDQWYWFLGTSLGVAAFQREPLADYRQHSDNVYGIGPKHGRLDTLRFILENRVDMYRRMETCAARQAKLLGQAVFEDAVMRQKLEVACSAWTDLSKLYHERAKLYDTAFVGRIGTMRLLIKMRAYDQSRFWTFGRKSLLKDLVLGVLLAPLVRRFGAVAAGEDWTCAAVNTRSCVQGLCQ